MADLEVFELLSHAVLDSAEVEFRYGNCAARPLKRGGCDPITSVASITSGIFSASISLASRCALLPCPRIRDPRRTGARFRRPANFSIGKFLDSSFGIFQGNGRTTVRVRFQPFAAQLVRERIWHHSQKIRELRDGGLELQLQLGSLEEIERWILSWGDQAEVLEPAKLRQRLAEVGRKFVAEYSAQNNSSGKNLCPSDGGCLTRIW